jgi:predicted nucleic acid-binding protein
VSFLLDTNVISEVRQGDRCDPNVRDWYASADEAELYLSVVVLGEIRRGIELARPRDPDKARALEAWLNELASQYAERLLPIDGAVAEEWGRMSARRTVPTIDCLLAATAKAHAMTLVTRNALDVDGLGAVVLNPFLA